jgi:RND family efflux transporter MFP subunit
MATQGPVVAMDIAALSARLLELRELAPRARLAAQAVADLLPGSAVNIYILGEQDAEPVWIPQAGVGDVSVTEAAVPLEKGAMGTLAGTSEAVAISGKELMREEYAHLHVRRTVQALAYVPLKAKGDLIGAVEIVSFEGELRSASLAVLQPIADVIGVALASASEYEQERHSTLSSITRLTQLYDIEKVLNSTLELDQLLPLIGSKFKELLECQALNVWLLEGDQSVTLMHQAGVDPTTHEGQAQKPGEGLAGDVSDNGEPLLIDSAEDERLVQRNAGIDEGAIFSILLVPLIDRGSLVGVVEAVNKLDGTAFDEDDLFALTTFAETASSALHNASLLMAERKVEILEALVKTSGEITSTLDLDRVLQAVVNGPAAVIPYERAAIALDDRGGTRLRAVSGTTQLNADEPQYRGLREILQWSAVLSEPLLVAQHGDEVESDREETKAKFQQYFAESGMRACHLLPLVDEEGRVGVLLFESSDPDFLSEAHLEMIKVLASQATVALRNASLYKEVPFISVLQPLVERKKRFLALEKHKRAALVIGVAAVLVFLLAVPLPLRVDGNAVVAPARVAHIGSEFEGVIKAVDVREGDVVKKGAPIAELEDWDYRSALSAAQAKQQTAVAAMDRALANNDGSEAGIQRAQADYWASEVKRAEDRLAKTIIRSPIDGVIATPQVENLVGHKLKDGDSFVDIVDNSEEMVDVAIGEADVALLKPGQKANLKLDGFPERTFHGQVAVVSPQGVLQNAETTFYARVAVANPDNVLRSGMQGRGKISTGLRPAGVVMFRRVGIWIWTKLWDWFGW